MIVLFFSAIGLGLAFCAPPGAVTAEALRRGLARGFRPALSVEIGSLVGDATWAAIALIGAAFLVQKVIARTGLGLLGAGFLFRLGWQALRDARAGALPKTQGASARGDFAIGALLSLTNPFTIAFWLGVGGGAVTSIVPDPAPVDFAIFFGGFMLACIAWCFIMSGLIAFGRQLLRPAFFRVVDAVCGLTLIYFALRLLARVFLVA